MHQTTQLKGVGLRAELELGQRELSARFQGSPACILTPSKSLVAGDGSRDVIYRLLAGWACQIRGLPNNRRAIIDIYLPGDIIGLDQTRRTRLPNEALTITSVTVERIEAKYALVDLMTTRPTALYIAWLLGQRQRRIDRRLAAISCLDARGRLATMMLDFYTRLRRRRLVTGSKYNFPLTQIQIGDYLGLTVVHLNRVLRSLRDDAIIKLEKRCVNILDLERLMSLGQPETTMGSIPDIEERPLSAAAD
jgi:CRP/FNR family transcriptional regulator, anaerobic regulatory protein